MNRSWIAHLWLVMAACGGSEREPPRVASTIVPADSPTVETPATTDAILIPLPGQVDAPAATTDTARVSVGLLRVDARLVHVFAYHSGVWTEVDTAKAVDVDFDGIPDSIDRNSVRNPVLVPADWLVHGYDGAVRPFKARWRTAISDDRYDPHGYTTDWPPDTSFSHYRPNPRVGIAVAGPAQAAPLVALDTTSAEWREIVAIAWPAFVTREQQAVAASLEKSPCSYVPRGRTCDPAAERARWISDGRLPNGPPLDSTARALGKVRMTIAGPAAPQSHTLYHVRIYRSYPAHDGGGCGPESYYQANVLRSGSLAVSDATHVFTDCDGKQTSGLKPLALLILGARTFVIAASWGWESGDTFIRELTGGGLVTPAGLR